MEEANFHETSLESQGQGQGQVQQQVQQEPLNRQCYLTGENLNYGSTHIRIFRVKVRISRSRSSRGRSSDRGYKKVSE